MFDFGLVSPFVAVGIALALIFDFLNGMNDAANSIATSVSTRVLSPRVGIVWAACFNVLGAVAFGVGVATTIGKGIVEPSLIDPTTVVAALVGAIIWVYLCTRFGLPISVSHALIGGLCGAAVLKTGGVHALVWTGLAKVGAFIVLSPLVGFVGSVFCMSVFNVVVHNWTKRSVEQVFSKLQLASAACYSLAHGSNDAQKTMGIITVLLYSAGVLRGDFHVPWIVIVACTLAIGLGTLAGGWKVIRTMGMRLTKLRPIGGCAAETGASISVISCSLLGIPVSTTHTIAGSIVGVGVVRSVGAVRWGVATHIIWAWLLTIPVSAGVGALSFWALRALGL